MGPRLISAFPLPLPSNWFKDGNATQHFQLGDFWDFCGNYWDFHGREKNLFFAQVWSSYKRQPGTGGGFLRLGPTQRKAELREAIGHILPDSLESLDPATPKASLHHLRILMNSFFWICIIERIINLCCFQPDIWEFFLFVCLNYNITQFIVADSRRSLSTLS